MAIATESNLSKLTKAELVAALTDLAQAVELKDAEIEALSTVSAPAAPAAPADSKVPADLMLSGFLRACVPATRKDGSTVDGLFKVAIQATVSVNFGGSDKASWDYQDINHKTTWLVADASVAAQAMHLLDTNAWTVVRGWYRLTSRPVNVQDVAQIDFVTKQKRTDDSGQVLMTRALKYAPDLKLAQIDVVTSAESADSDDGSVI